MVQPKGYMLTWRAVQALKRILKWWEGGGHLQSMRARQPAQRPPIMWGKLTADWDGATPNQVKVNLCDQAGVLKDQTSDRITFTIHIVTPIDEEPKGVTLVTDDVIAFVPFWDMENGEQRGVMVGGGQGGTILWGKATRNWTSAAGNGCYVRCNPCDNLGGDNPDAETTVDVYLPRDGSTEDPNVVSGAILAYHLDANGTAVARDSHLDGTITKSVQIWRGAPADIATDKPGWEREDNWDDGLFLVPYDPDDADYDCPWVGGGYKWHGQTENNHTDHCEEHTHCLTALLCGYDIGTPPGWILPCQPGTTGAAVWGDANHAKHYGAANEGADTDNRPPFKPVFLIRRANNAENA